VACIDENGYITRTAELILLSMMEAATIEHSAIESRIQLFRVRSAVRELKGLGLLREMEDEYQTTEEGIRKLEGKKGQKP
jgi:hypothetical protein